MESAGVTGVPRFYGIDSEDREILSYLPGDTGHGVHPWTDEQLTDLARLTRAIHDALAGSPEAGTSETVCHNDVAPWNTILRSGRPVAFIDFDDAAPGTRTDDLAYLLWTFLNLGSSSAPAEIQGHRMRHFCDAYATGDEQLGCRSRSELLAALDRQQHRILSFRAAQPDPFSAEKHKEILTSIAWTHLHHATLAAHLAVRP